MPSSESVKEINAEVVTAHLLKYPGVPFRATNFARSLQKEGYNVSVDVANNYLWAVSASKSFKSFATVTSSNNSLCIKTRRTRFLKSNGTVLQIGLVAELEKMYTKINREFHIKKNACVEKKCDELLTYINTPTLFSSTANNGAYHTKSVLQHFFKNQGVLLTGKIFYNILRKADVWISRSTVTLYIKAIINSKAIRPYLTNLSTSTRIGIKSIAAQMPTSIEEFQRIENSVRSEYKNIDKIYQDRYRVKKRDRYIAKKQEALKALPLKEKISRRTRALRIAPSMMIDTFTGLSGYDINSTMFQKLVQEKGVKVSTSTVYRYMMSFVLTDSFREYIKPSVVSGTLFLQHINTNLYATLLDTEKSQIVSDITTTYKLIVNKDASGHKGAFSNVILDARLNKKNFCTFVKECIIQDKSDKGIDKRVNAALTEKPQTRSEDVPKVKKKFDALPDISTSPSITLPLNTIEVVIELLKREDFENAVLTSSGSIVFNFKNK